jgi:hypothetical protein
MIIDVTWVDGLGNIHRSRNPSPEFHAISAGLGLTGIVTEIKLQLTPPTNTKLITRYLSSDATLFDDIEKMLKVRGGAAGGEWGGGLGGWGRARVSGSGRERQDGGLRPPASLPPTAPARPRSCVPPPAPQHAPHMLVFW